MVDTISPEDAVERYLNSRRDAMPSTIAEHRLRLGKFLAFAEQEGVDTLDALDGATIDAYRQYRLDDSETTFINDQKILTTNKTYSPVFGMCQCCYKGDPR